MELNRFSKVNALTGRSLLVEKIDCVAYLFLQLQYRRFIAMEMAVLTLVEQALEGKDKSVQWMLHDFNRYYCSWLETRHENVEKETDDLRSLEHDNYLLAYCQGVPEMEEILTEAYDYVTFSQTDHQKSLVKVLVKNYRHRYL
jgi:hypothetical protein